MRPHFRKFCSRAAILCVLLGLIAPAAFTESQILGEIRLHPSGDVARLAGVWVDGLYLGYAGELKGDKKILLLPGVHRLTIRYVGYEDYRREVAVEPHQKTDVGFSLRKQTAAPSPEATSKMKLDVTPERAAVFINGAYVGHVDEFNGLGQWMLLPPGSYHLRISLLGYQPLVTSVSLHPGQKYELKTALVPGTTRQSGPLVDRQQAAGASGK